ncbi:26S proteasome non-ATPase regulatory subunit 9 [Telopea speciosissima]|uniref:26S proteasome non-ATPase regulatory subunit 9 n=1 Tax=Telopea speciosissima TaxID=54955 RepID=UPI001CC4EFCE|nr:26S proteasome non-ATPase regulatory subunit 9 [Telopea speciosissima]
MVAMNLKAKTMSLMEQREAMEREMNDIIARLCQSGGPGISGNLVDEEGFPRSDIDIPAVRADRHRLAELRNEHEDITDKINENLIVLHSAKVAHNSSLPVKGEGEGSIQASYDANSVPSASSSDVLPEDTASTMDMDMFVSVPFAVVDEITDGSPAAEDGLQLGDRIMKFGNVGSGDGLLQKLASEAQSNQGRPVSLVVMRQGTQINLTVTPRSWQGRGLLGCHFQLL